MVFKTTVAIKKKNNPTKALIKRQEREKTIKQKHLSKERVYQKKANAFPIEALIKKTMLAILWIKKSLTYIHKTNIMYI